MIGTVLKAPVIPIDVEFTYRLPLDVRYKYLVLCHIEYQTIVNLFWPLDWSAIAISVTSLHTSDRFLTSIVLLQIMAMNNVNKTDNV